MQVCWDRSPFSRRRQDRFRSALKNRQRWLLGRPAVELTLLDNDEVMPALAAGEVFLGPPVKCDQILKVWTYSWEVVETMYGLKIAVI